MPRNKKKYQFSEEEKKLIHDMKDQLRMMGVPRSEWSKIIQDELTHLSRSKKGLGGIAQRAEKSGFFGKIKEKISGFFRKLIAKRMGVDDDMMQAMMQDPFGEMSQEEQDMMNQLFSGFQVDQMNVDELGTGGAVFSEKKQRKIVDLDFEDEE